jgi:ribosomal protein L1
MMKRMTLFVFSMLSIMVFCSVSLAVELTNIEKVPSTYAKTVEKDGKKVIEFGNDAIVYEPEALDKILAGYGLTLQNTATVPSTYATTVEKDGKKVIEFGNDAINYEPERFDKILAGYNS